MNEGTDSQKNAASFRDPSGFVFRKDGVLYRAVNKVYTESYDLLMGSGLYAELAKENLLVAHEEVREVRLDANGYKIIRPEIVPFISYPYEWCFSELKDAALLTLKIQKVALEHGMTLKDASAYNVQFKDGRPILIDTLSFERYEEGIPWVAYRQFCSHFLAPLGLMSMKDVRLSQLLRIYIDGIPLDLASALLPLRSWLNSSMFFHVHMHSKSQRRFSDKKVNIRGAPFSRISLESLIANLRAGVQSLRWEPKGTEWGDYYGNTNYSEVAMAEKRKAMSRFMNAVNPKSVWDLGANDGFFSRVFSDHGVNTIAFDIDPAAVEKSYLMVKNKEERHLLPLVMDLTNPSGPLGWSDEERESLIERGPADVGLALALVHHLAISNNVPFEMMAEFFAKICKALIIEFVPRGDSQVERLLKNRADIFNAYTKENFEKAFDRYWVISESYPIPTSQRTLYLMRRRR